MTTSMEHTFSALCISKFQRYRLRDGSVMKKYFVETPGTGWSTYSSYDISNAFWLVVVVYQGTLLRWGWE